MNVRGLQSCRTAVIGISILWSKLLIAAPSFCESSFQDVGVQNRSQVEQVAVDNLKNYENIFTRARDLARYKMAFGPSFSEVLAEISEKGGHWIDAGSGDAIAIRQFLAASPRASGTAISVESSAETSERLKVVKGRFIEDIAPGEVTKARVITDVIGGLAYSGSPHLVLRQYFDWLDASGETFVFMGTRDVYGLTNRVITADGRYLNLVEWIKQIPGIKMELLVETRVDDGVTYEKWAMKLVRDRDQALDIPDLVLKELVPGAPPTMLFKETAFKFKNISEASVLEAQRKVRMGIEKRRQDVASEMTFTQFMDSFRGGEIVHPLVSAVKGLQPWQSWVNVSIYGAGVKQDLLNKSFDGSSDKVFFGPSQRWIQYRVNAISPENFQYVHLPTGLGLEKINDVRVLTDFYGDFLVSLRPDVALRRYIKVIGDSGSAFIFLGPENTGYGVRSDILTAAGQRLRLRDWLKAIPGLDVKLFRGGYAYTGGEWTFVRIRKKQSNVAIPELEFLGGDLRGDGEIPAMIFQEK